MNKTQIAIHLIDLLLNLFLMREEKSKEARRKAFESDKEEIKENPADFFNDRYGRKK